MLAIQQPICQRRTIAKLRPQSVTLQGTAASAIIIMLLVALALPTRAFAKNAKQVVITELAADERTPRSLRITADGAQTLDLAPTLSAVAICESRMDAGAAWAIAEWVVGQELYKAYQDPAAVCGGSYPFTVTSVHMLLQVAAATSIVAAVDIETVDSVFSPGCPVPGEMVYLGDPVYITFPAAGLYDVTIELSAPTVVEGPFFAGFFFGSIVDPAAYLSLVTDSVEKTCVTFNIWDTTLGYIDLGDDISVHESVYTFSDPCRTAPANAPGCFDFDGRVILFTTGIISDNTGCCIIPGDANHNGMLSIGDVLYILNYIFNQGPAPECLDEADVNGNNSVNVADAQILLSNIFRGISNETCGTTGK